MDFTTSSAKNIYSDRSAHPVWEQWCLSTLMPEGKDVADIGCGGGIYLRAFSSLGASSVVGIDSSPQYIAEAVDASKGYGNITYVVANATNTGLDNRSIDIAFERALIHHFSINQKKQNIIELRRILRPLGMLAVQDRTYEDVCSIDSAHWIRATLFKCFPQLLEYERFRRPLRSGYREMLKKLGFQIVGVVTLDEVRKVYASFTELETEMLARKGKSILFELSDTQLKHYCAELEKVSVDQKLEEIDRWTIWVASAP